MRKLLQMPAYLSLAVVVAMAGALAAANAYFTGPLFHETCRNERNLLSGEFEASNCAAGAGLDLAKTPGAATTSEKGSAIGDAPSPMPEAEAPMAGVIAAGRFVDGAPGHQGKGLAEVQRLEDGRLNLFLSNFSVTNGPDLVVVLSPDPEGSQGSVADGLMLGSLKANNGNQNYTIPEGTDSSRYASVIIYCKSFPTVFAHARLEVQQ